MIKRNSSIEDFYTVDELTGCWLWDGGKSVGGYGLYNVSGYMRYAHKIIYEKYKGKVPEGLQLDHFKNKTHGCPRHCVNPDHLEPVTQIVNLRRGKRIVLNTWKVYKIKEKLPFRTHQSIADEFGVCKSTITCISLGRIWKDVICQI